MQIARPVENLITKLLITWAMKLKYQFAYNLRIEGETEQTMKLFANIITNLACIRQNKHIKRLHTDNSEETLPQAKFLLQFT